MKKILKVTSILSVVTVMKIAAGIVRAKFLAWQIGPAGIGLVSQALTYSAFTIQLCSLSVAMGITKNISESAAQGDREKAAMTVNMSVTMQFIASILFMALALPFSRPLSGFLFFETRYLWYFIGITATTPFALFLVGIADPVFYGFRKIPEYTKLMTWYTAIGLILIFAAVWFFGTDGMLMQIMAISIIGFTISYYFIVKVTSIRPRIDFGIFRKAESKEMMRQLLKYGLTSFLMGIATILATLYLRSLLIKRFGVAANGYYQVACAMSALYLPFVTNAIWGYFYPQMCGLKDEERMALELNQFIRFSLLAVSAIAAGCIIFRKYFILVLYAKDFMQAYDLLPIQAVGDIFFILVYIFNTALLARKNFRGVLVISVLGYNAGLIALYMAMADMWGMGISSLNSAVAAANILCAAALLAYYRFETGFSLSGTNTGLFLKSLVFLAVVYLIPGDGLPAISAKAAISALWLMAVLTRDEIRKTAVFLTGYFKNRTSAT